jgi:amino acid permease
MRLHCHLFATATAILFVSSRPVSCFLERHPAPTRACRRRQWRNALPTTTTTTTTTTKIIGNTRKANNYSIRELHLSIPAGGAQQQEKGGTASIPNEIFNLVKCIVGAGVLSLSAGVAEFGNAPSALIPATLLIWIMGAISAYTFSMLARVSAMTGAISYSDAWEKTRGKSTSWMIAFSSALDCFAGNLTYSMVLADTFQALLSAIGIIGVTRTNALLGLTSLVLLPLCLVKNLTALAPFSLIGIMGMLYTTFAIGVRYFGGAYAVTTVPAGKLLSSLPLHMHPSFGSTGAMGAVSPKSLLLVCMLSTAYIAHFNAIKFYKELKNNTLERFNLVVASSFGIAVTIYMAVTSMGFLTFGSSTAGMILNNYATNDILISLSRFAVAISLVFSYPLLFVGTRDGLFDLLKVSENRRTDSLQNKVSVGLVAILTGLAIQVHNLTFVASMSGAILGTALIFIYPTLMFRAAIAKMGEKATKSQRNERKLAGFIAGAGVVVGGIGANLALKTLGS